MSRCCSVLRVCILLYTTATRDSLKAYLNYICCLISLCLALSPLSLIEIGYVVLKVTHANQVHVCILRIVFCFNINYVLVKVHLMFSRSDILN